MAAIIVKDVPPIDPSQVFLGDILSNSLCLPIEQPIIYAPTSFDQIKMNNVRGITKLYSVIPLTLLGMKAKTERRENGSAMYRIGIIPNARFIIGLFLFLYNSLTKMIIRDRIKGMNETKFMYPIHDLKIAPNNEIEATTVHSMLISVSFFLFISDTNSQEVIIVHNANKPANHIGPFTIQKANIVTNRKPVKILLISSNVRKN